MKKLFLIVFGLTLPLLGFSQTIDLGVHAAISSTWLLNQNVNDQGPNLNPASTFAPSFGINGRFMINPTIGVLGELNLASIHQKYSGDISGFSFDVLTKTKWVEIPVLLVIRSTGGFYFEVGPQFSFLSSAKETLTTDPTTPGDYEDKDFKDNFNGAQVAGAFGFGGDVPVSDNLRLIAGLRFSYGFTDAIKELTQSEFTAMSIDGDLSVPAFYAHTDQQGDFSYEKTKILAGGFRFGIAYILGDQ